MPKRIGSRYEQSLKKRRVNRILNSLIAIVIALIIIVAASIFLGDNKTKQVMEEQAKIERQQEVSTKPTNLSPAITETEENKTEESETEGSKETIIVEEVNEENVEKVIINPSWEPIGTEQVSGHEPSWDMESIDWKEKEKAAAYAIQIPVENMTNWWTERGADPINEAILTVSEKGTSNVYRVYIEWVDGQGWKPTKVKKLIENDKKQ